MEMRLERNCTAVHNYFLSDSKETCHEGADFYDRVWMFADLIEL